MSAVTLAKKTVALIDATIKADQGNSFRGWLGKVIPHIGDAYRQDEEPFRTHMGASLIGGDCRRAIWYGFRWATKPNFEGRLMRLFNRGHIEEARFIAMLLMIGCQVYQQDENGKQFRISEYGGHFGGSGDGVAIGIPDVPAGTACLLEFKTHNDKSFKKLKEPGGVRAAKFEHYVQMQMYLRKMNLAVALYLAVNKNDDELYGEIVSLDSAFADTFFERAGKIIPIRVAPDKISKSPGWFACSWCDHKPVCHMGAAPERNCRTCDFAEPDMTDGTWKCENKERQMTMLFGPSPDVSDEGETFTLTKSRQLKACKFYQKNPSFS